MRRGEIIGLRWRNVDFARGVIKVVESDYRGELKPPKNLKGREVPMTPELRAALEAHPREGERVLVRSGGRPLDMQTVRISGLNNRVPGAVLALEVIGAAAALGLLGLYLSVLGRGVLPVVLAAALISMLLLVTFDLDRPVRGLITVPSTPLDSLRASMALPPAAGP